MALNTNLLAEYTTSAARKQFTWGSFDCCTFAADWILLCKGVDVYSEYRGKYSTPLGAYRLFNAKGGLRQAMSDALKAHGFELIDANFARRGDVALVQQGRKIFAGVVVSGGVAVAGSRGVKIVQRSVILNTWRVE
jgi:hypothetical protein